MRLHGKHVLIVGASMGLGKGLSLALLSRDCRLTLFARSIETLGQEPAVLAAGDRVRLIPGDLCRPADIETLGRAVEQGPPLDGLIVTAGVSRPDLVEALDVERAIDTITVNLEGPVRVIYRVLPLLMARPGSFLAGFTSMAGDRGMPRGHAYSAAKAGLDRFLDSLRIDLYDRDVRVFTVVPGYVDTPMAAQNRFPMPGMWPLEKASEYLVRCFERERLVIRFPWYHSLGMRLLTALPARVYWWLMNRQRTQVKIAPRPEDRFTWPCDS